MRTFITRGIETALHVKKKSRPRIDVKNKEMGAKEDVWRNIGRASGGKSILLDTFGGAIPRFSNRGKKRRLRINLDHTPSFAVLICEANEDCKARGVECVDFQNQIKRVAPRILKNRIYQARPHA